MLVTVRVVHCGSGRTDSRLILLIWLFQTCFWMTHREQEVLLSHSSIRNIISIFILEVSFQWQQLGKWWQIKLSLPEESRTFKKCVCAVRKSPCCFFGVSSLSNAGPFRDTEKRHHTILRSVSNLKSQSVSLQYARLNHEPLDQFSLLKIQKLICARFNHSRFWHKFYFVLWKRM